MSLKCSSLCTFCKSNPTKLIYFERLNDAMWSLSDTFRRRSRHQQIYGLWLLFVFIFWLLHFLPYVTTALPINHWKYVQAHSLNERYPCAIYIADSPSSTITSFLLLLLPIMIVWPSVAVSIHLLVTAVVWYLPQTAQMVWFLMLFISHAKINLPRFQYDSYSRHEISSSVEQKSNLINIPLN